MLQPHHQIRHMAFLVTMSLALTFLFMLGISPAHASTSSDQLRITEIMYDPVGSGDREFLEFYNGGDVTINLSGWSTTGVTFTFGNVSIAPGRYGVIVRNSAAFSQVHPSANLYGQYEGKLKGSGERVELKNSSGAVISSVHYGVGTNWPTSTKDGGPSLSLNRTTANETNASCWSPSSQNGGTPDAPNSVDTSWSNAHSGSCPTKNYVMTKAASSAVNEPGDDTKSSSGATDSGATAVSATAPLNDENSGQSAASKESPLEQARDQSKASQSLIDSPTPRAQQVGSKIILASALSAILILIFSSFKARQNSNHKKKLESLLNEMPLN